MRRSFCHIGTIDFQVLSKGDFFGFYFYGNGHGCGSNGFKFREVRARDKQNRRNGWFAAAPVYYLQQRGGFGRAEFSDWRIKDFRSPLSVLT